MSGGLIMLDCRGLIKTAATTALLLLVCGCAIPSWLSDPNGLRPAETVSRWQGAPGTGQPGSAQHPDGTLLAQPRTPPVNEQIALMSQRLGSADDDRRVLTARLQLVEGQLEEKEKALALATKEIQDSTAQIARARTDLQQWKKDMKVLRDKLGGMEKDNREALDAMIKTLEQVLERDREQLKGDDLPVLEALPLPRRSDGGVKQ